MAAPYDDVVRSVTRAAGLFVRPRRPAGDPPLLPHGLARTARPWVLALALAVVWVWLPGLGASGQVNSVDDAILRWCARYAGDLRATFPALSAGAAIRVVGWAVVVVLVATRQWRRLAVFVGVVQLTLVTTMAETLARPRPYGVGYLVRAGGDALPSWPVAGVAVTAVAAAYALVPSGHRRRRTLAVTATLVAVFAIARVLLGLDRPSAAVVGAVFGASLAVVGFDVLAPDALFPVRRNRVPAHLDLDSRSAMIARAVLEQAGLHVVRMEPFNLAGSAGSTPMLLTLDRPGPERLFAKLYSTSHLRSDRAFKMVRAIRYGALEDEAPFANVRSLVEHEDYLLRVMRDAGVRVPHPLGVVEVAPEREYLLLTEFLDDAAELQNTDVDDFVIDDALAQVRTMWRAGIAHRDIKPSNVLLRADGVWLIDVAFGEVRPSAWRRSVDLANMMLVLALRADLEQVLDRARVAFETSEIAAAFAATHAVTMPSQLRALLHADGRDLPALFRKELPPMPTVRVQRWTPRRLGIAAAALGSVAGAAALLWLNLNATGWL